MKIVKYKKLSGSKYEVYLEDGSKIKLYEDVILKEELLLKKEIDDVDEILKKNSKYEINDVALKYLSHHVTSIKGMREYLSKKNYNFDDILNTMKFLIDKGYLNDSYYAKCYILDHINLSSDGPYKIIKHLEDNEIYSNIYSEYLDIESSIWKERIDKYLEKQIKINKKSLYSFKSKMLFNLINLGYDREMINNSLLNVSIANQDDLKEKEKEKIRKRLERKYSGKELEQKIREKLYQKGFFE